MAEYRTQLNIRVKEAQKKKIDQIAKERKITVQEFMEGLITDYLAMISTKNESEDKEFIPVKDETGQIIARVEYNNNLDYWNGSNWTAGSVGRHKGLTQLVNGEYVLIFGSQWQGEKDHATIITKQEALQEILTSGNTELLESFPELNQLMESTLIKEK